MKKIIIFSFCLFLMSISCSKKDNSSTSITPSAIKYMTTTPGSIWNYELIDSIALSTSLYSLTSTSRDTSVNSKNYHIYTNSASNASEYYNISASDYYSYQSLPSAAGGTKAENLYLKDNANINVSWSQSYPVTVSGFPLTVILTNTIKERSISKIVNGITYAEVIHVETTIAVSGIPATSLTSDIQSYYAPKVGLIENDTKIKLNYLTLVNNTNTQTKLKTTNIP